MAAAWTQQEERVVYSSWEGRAQDRPFEVQLTNYWRESYIEKHIYRTAPYLHIPLLPPCTFFEDEGPRGYRRRHVWQMLGRVLVLAPQLPAEWFVLEGQNGEDVSQLYPRNCERFIERCCHPRHETLLLRGQYHPFQGLLPRYWLDYLVNLTFLLLNNYCCTTLSDEEYRRRLFLILCTALHFLGTQQVQSSLAKNGRDEQRAAPSTHNAPTGNGKHLTLHVLLGTCCFQSEVVSSLDYLLCENLTDACFFLLLCAPEIYLAKEVAEQLRVVVVPKFCWNHKASKGQEGEWQVIESHYGPLVWGRPVMILQGNPQRSKYEYRYLDYFATFAPRLHYYGGADPQWPRQAEENQDYWESNVEVRSLAPHLARYCSQIPLFRSLEACAEFPTSSDNLENFFTLLAFLRCHSRPYAANLNLPPLRASRLHRFGAMFVLLRGGCSEPDTIDPYLRLARRDFLYYYVFYALGSPRFSACILQLNPRYLPDHDAPYQSANPSSHLEWGKPFPDIGDRSEEEEKCKRGARFFRILFQLPEEVVWLMTHKILPRHYVGQLRRVLPDYRQEPDTLLGDWARDNIWVDDSPNHFGLDASWNCQTDTAMPGVWRRVLQDWAAYWVAR